MSKTRILIRFDDICPTMNWELWEQATELMDAYDVKPLIGVIPDCEDIDLQINTERPNFWEYIKNLQNKGYAIAMHGYQHIFSSNHKGVVNNRIGSEFAGLSYDIQFNKIKDGKEIFEKHGIKTEIFFSPAHSYDYNTLRALKANGFRYMSDGKSMKPILREGIICIPCRNGGCPRIKKNGFYTAVFHPNEWERPEKKIGIKHLKKLLEQYNKEIVCFSDFCKQEQGNIIYQSFIERLYIVYEYGIYNKWIRIKHMLKTIIKKM